jgi:hypothetical protein
MVVSALRLSLEVADLIREGARGTPKSCFMGTTVSGLKPTGLKPELGAFGVSIAHVSRGTLSSD